MPKKLWPTGMATLNVPLTGKLRTPAEPGRALGRLSDVGWGPRLRVLLAAPDSEIPDDVLRAVVDVLAQWRWARGPLKSCGCRVERGRS